MDQLKGIRARLRSLFGKRAADQRMNEEFLFHLEMETEKHIQRGLAPDEARRRALVAFGGVSRHREDMRDGRGMRWLVDLGSDLRYAGRMLRHSPLFAIAAAVTIALGVGLNGVVFSIINGLMFRPLPAAHPEQLVAVYTVDRQGREPDALSYEDYLDLRDRSGIFAGVATQWGLPLNVEAGEAPEMLWAEMVSENFFGVLAMQPAAGRFFSAAAVAPGANPSAVLSYASWQDRFQGDPRVIGRTLRINGSPFQIVGVAPKGFKGMRTFGFWPELWVPISEHEVLVPGSRHLLEGRGPGSFTTFARMQPGWTQQRAAAATTLFARQLAQAFPKTNADMSLMLVAARTGFDNPGFVRPKLQLLASSLGIFGVTLVLIVICANLANLMLARTSARERELAIRLSLGCSRERLVRQLLVEAAVLALPGVLLGIALTFATPVLQSRMLPHLQFRVGFDVTPDRLVVLYTVTIAVLSVLLFGLSPALRASRPALVPSLKTAGGAPSGAIQRGGGMRAVLVVVQLALSVVLLVCGSLFVRSLYAARAIDVGFDATDRVVMSVNPGLQRYDEAHGRVFYRNVLQKTRALPGVVSASWGFPVPFDSYGRGVGLYVEGLPTKSGDHVIGLPVSVVDAGFFEAVGLEIVAGRAFAPADSTGTPLRMIVSRGTASRLWPGRDPIGQRARLRDANGPELTVVGIAADAKFNSVGEAAESHVYLPLQQNYRGWQTLVVHSRGAPDATMRNVRRVIAEVDPALPVFGAMTMETGIASALNGAETAASFAGFFGVVALLIAATGLYALVANAVTERTREIGVRVALGATPGRVLALVVGNAGRVAVIGLVCGVVAAAAMARLLGSLLYGISEYDPLSFLVVPLVLAIVVLVASYLPARRATKLDAAAALRAS